MMQPLYQFVLDAYSNTLNCALFLTMRPSKHLKLLEKLGLGQENLGVFNGKWMGSGPIVHSVNPATNDRIASTITGTVQDLHQTLRLQKQLEPMWKAVQH
jgi:aldehyde dehydrogenase family 7 protein A1